MNAARLCRTCRTRYAQEDGECRQCAGKRIGDYTRGSSWHPRIVGRREKKPLRQAGPVQANVSWWASCAQPGDRDRFIEAAKLRHVERTQLEDAKEGRKNQAMRHVVDPRAFPPRPHETRRG